MNSPPIAHVVVNSLEPSARARVGPIFQLFLGPSIALAKRIWGGLWVGGDLYLDNDAIRFEPNAINTKFHHGDLSWKLRFETVESVTLRKAMVTNIIDVAYLGGTKSVRCYGAEKFAQQINTARTRTLPTD